MQFFYLDGDRIWVRQNASGVEATFPQPAVRPDIVERVADGFAVAAAKEAPAPGAKLLPLRSVFDSIGSEAFRLAGIARQLLFWRQTYRFCSVCGTPLVRHATEHAMACPACKQLFYPRLNPVVIVAVGNGPRLLLTHKAHNLYPFWSVTAGFVEPNETLEAAVAREVGEEVGIRIQNIRYVDSQPWPFPNNLMVGFEADYAGGELKPDGVEIEAADWFAADALPAIPSSVSIGRRLIDRFFREHR